ncbi:MAG: DM13 domain-containing protein [Bradymonadaceae bacterium]
MRWSLVQTTLPALLATMLGWTGCSASGSGPTGPPARDASGDSAPDRADDGASDTLDTAQMPRGEQVFRTPLEEGNTFACATCHAVHPPAKDGFRKPGHPLGNATRRPSYKDGKLDSMLAAVNTCLVEWMNASKWTQSNEKWRALRSWLDSKAKVESAEPVDIQIVEPPDDLTGGDPQAGEQLFNESCAGCHGKNGTGTRRAPPLDARPLDRSYIARRIRTSGLTDSPTYDGLTGGKMPFWGADRLSDDELLDVVAYVHELSRDVVGGDVGPDGSFDAGPGDVSDGGRDAAPPDTAPDTAGGDTGATGDSGCAATHRKVGWTAELNGKFHNVGGTAKIVDDCTVVVSNFTFDGNGVVVEIYGATQHGNYAAGYSMSRNLVRPNPYRGERLVLTLPSNKSLDDLGGISVWCVDVGVSFGSGKFTPP